MPEVPLEEASAHLDDLIRAAMRGDEIIITKDSLPVARVVAITHERPKPRFGSARGQIQMADDFDAPLEDFKDYMQ